MKTTLYLLLLLILPVFLAVIFATNMNAQPISEYAHLSKPTQDAILIKNANKLISNNLICTDTNNLIQKLHVAVDVPLDETTRDIETNAFIQISLLTTFPCSVEDAETNIQRILEEQDNDH